MNNTLTYKDWTIELHNEDDAESPREWDNLGTMACFHNRYNLGDKHDFADAEGLTEAMQKLTKKGGIVLPLYLYDHSGITMATKPFGDRWDSGQVGYIYVTQDRIMNEYGATDQAAYNKARHLLEGEVNDYDKYLRGEVYYVVVTSPDCKISESISGFYDEKDAIADAKEMIDELGNEPRRKEVAPYSGAYHQ
jgi:hypothetical protein